jgi:hypothetical protein
MIASVEAAAGATVLAGLVPVMVLEAESEAVIFWVPAVFRTTLPKVWAPSSAAVKG